MKNIKIMLWYDVEDFITPEADDALLALLDMMDGLGVRSSLKIVGEKIRVLQKRGRTDILSRLAGHEICYHTENHSIHPTQTEYLQHMGFREGAEEFEKREGKGFDDVQRITGQFPTSYGQPGGSWAPQSFPVLKKWGIPTYLDTHELISVDGKPFHYGGVLNLTQLWATMRLEFDESGGLEAAKARFDAICSRADDLQLVSIFYHPCEFSCTQFWDGVNFSRGDNPPPALWKGAPLQPEGEMQRRVDLLGEFLRYTMTHEGVEFITAQQCCRYEKINPNPISREDVRRMLASLPSGPDYFQSGARSLCASEILSLLARYTLGLHLTPEFIYGPEAHIDSVISVPAAPAALAQAVQKQYHRVFGYKQLPELYEVGENRINPVDLFMNLQRAVLLDLPVDQPMNLFGGAGSLQSARHVNSKFDWVGSWPVFSSDLDVSGIVRHAQLQTWTLKPAVF